MVANGRVLVMAGGTGGHVFPALAVAREMRERGYHIEWLGTRVGIEAEKVPAAGYKLHTLSVTGMRGKRLSVLIKAPFLLLLAIWQAIQVIRRLQPEVVLGMGGFASGPGGVASWLLRKPLVIHEQNAVPGTTNRMLAGLATRVLEGFRGAFGRRSTIWTGNPVRQDINQIQRAIRSQDSSLRLLVLGGSLGAQPINKIVPQAIAAIPIEQRPTVWHQAGRGKAEAVIADYQLFGCTAKVAEFIDDMATAYAWADIAICRAGALTVAELAASGLPAMLVPLPHAIDDHQTANAMWLQNAGAGIVLMQDELTADRLASMLLVYGKSPTQLAAMSNNARAVATPDATRAVADILEELCHG